MTKPIDFPLVSIITPLYNGDELIVETVASVQAQTHQNWEQIIVDDCSTDTSLSIVKELAENDKRIKVISLSQNKGAAHSRNMATDEAQGRYIAFLDADDLWHPEKLERQIGFMRQQDCAVSYTNYLHIAEDGSSLNKRIKAMPQLSYAKQHTNNYIGNLTGIYDVTKVGKIIAPNIRKRQDWAVWLEAIEKSNNPASGLQEDLAYYRIRKDSVSSNKVSLIKYNYIFYRKYLGHSSFKSSYYLFRFFWEYFFVRPRWIEDF